MKFAGRLLLPTGEAHRSSAANEQLERVVE